MTYGEMLCTKNKVRLPDGEVTTVWRFDYNLAHAANGLVQCDNTVWIKARNLAVLKMLKARADERR